MAVKSRSREVTKPTVGDERETIVNMKGSKTYVAWLEKVHKTTHIPKSQIVRLALTLWAETNGHPSPPEI